MGYPVPNQAWRSGVAEFRLNRFRYNRATEQLRYQIEFTNEYQIAGRPGVGNDDRHAALKSKPVERLALAVQVPLGVGIEYFVCLQESVDLVTGLEAQQLPQVGFGQAPCSILLRGQRFERAACEIGAICDETGGDIVRQGKGEVHGFSLTGMGPAVKARMTTDIAMCNVDVPASDRTMLYRSGSTCGSM